MKKTKRLKRIAIFILIFLIWSWVFKLLNLTVDSGLCPCQINIEDFPPGALVTPADCSCLIFLGRIPFYENLKTLKIELSTLLLIVKAILSFLTLKILVKFFSKK